MFRTLRSATPSPLDRSGSFQRCYSSDPQNVHSGHPRRGLDSSSIRFDARTPFLAGVSAVELGVRQDEDTTLE